MKVLKASLALVSLLAVAGLAYVAQEGRGSGKDMVAAAQGFLDSLTPEQKARATFDFDSKERFNWNFIPLQDKDRRYTRKGLPLEDMTQAQRQAALALLKAGTSEQGNAAATTIISLESILRDQEGAKGKMVRNPEWYFVTIFGTPANTGSWGWRVEGHHLSLNFTMRGNQVVASTPAFFGANPAEIKSGPRKGERILAGAEDHARELFGSLSEEQKKIAEQEKPFGEPGEKTLQPKVGDPVGLAAAKMSEAQRATLLKLLQAYTSRLAPDIAEQEMQQVQKGGLDKVHFAFQGSTQPGKPATYRVQGPTFLVEFLNVQADAAGNPANHIHSAWRRLRGDFGLQ